MIAYNYNIAKDYVHSLGEPTKELFIKITKAIEDGTLKGVDMAGSAACKLAESTLLHAPLKPARATIS